MILGGAGRGGGKLLLAKCYGLRAFLGPMLIDFFLDAVPSDDLIMECGDTGRALDDSLSARQKYVGPIAGAWPYIFYNDNQEFFRVGSEQVLVFGAGRASGCDVIGSRVFPLIYWSIGVAA